MKKEYVSPRVYLEEFAANEFIAKCTHHVIDNTAPANCINPKHYDGEVPTKKDDVISKHKERRGSTSEGRVNNVFTDIGTVCGSDVITGMRLSGGYFPQPGGEVFVLNGSEKLPYPNDSDKCYGSYWASAGSTEVYNPLS